MSRWGHVSTRIVDIPADHACRCPGCAPSAFPRGPRRAAGHLALRFGDEGRPEWWMGTIWVAGLPEWHALEVLPGPEGYVVRAVAFAVCPDGEHERGVCATHLCRCGADELCREVAGGDVRVEYNRPRVPLLARRH